MIELLVVLVVAGVVVWLFNTFVPMDARFKMVINALIGLFLFIYILECFGLTHFGLAHSLRH